MAETMTATALRIPPGPKDKYNGTEELFFWMNENFAQYGDIYRASVLGSNVYVVSNPEYCERILRRNWRNYTRSGQVVKRIALLLGSGLIASNGEFWANQRRMIQPAFSKNAIGGLAGVISNANAELLAKWKLAAHRGETVNVTEDVSLMVLKITLVSIFGEDYATAAPHFHVLAGESARNLEFAQSFRPLSKIILQIVAQRRHEGRTGSDFLASLMQARSRERGEPMPDPQLAKEVLTLVVAGHETTAGLLNWMWYLLARHPDWQARLSEEFSRLPWGEFPDMEMLPRYTCAREVIDESLRLYPPLWLMTRRAIQDDRLGDFFVPAGTEIYISPYLIQRSRDLWEEPERFDPGRMSQEREAGRPELAMCPFGAGPRNCIGEFFARVETQIHLMMFARDLWLRHDDQTPAEITTGMNLLSKHDFIMRPEPKDRTAA
ncbi:MAG TPA: cytochrome P450 [Acetobacteraceae bacterium]|nr:cytochrome P450 [Acetobacteraceae bacterium]